MANMTGRVCCIVLYIVLKTAFSFLWRQKKRKKRCGGEVGRRGDGRGAGPGGEDDGGGMAGGVPVVLVVCCGAATIKVCNYTAFEAVRGGGEGYFCTVPTLHRRRRWIGSR